MKNSTKLKLALLKEFGHPQGPIEKDFEEESGENDVNIGNKHYHPHREEEEYGVCDECGVPAMYEGKCMECGYMEEGHNLEEEKHEVFMAQRNLETIIKAATELLHKLGNEEREVPAWVADHITKAETYVEQANDGFYFEDEEGDEEDTAYTSEEEPEHNDDMTLAKLMEVVKAKVKPSKGLTMKPVKLFEGFINENLPKVGKIYTYNDTVASGPCKGEKISFDEEFVKYDGDELVFKIVGVDISDKLAKSYEKLGLKFKIGDTTRTGMGGFKHNYTEKK